MGNVQDGVVAEVPVTIPKHSDPMGGAMTLRGDKTPRDRGSHHLASAVS